MSQQTTQAVSREYRIAVSGPPAVGKSALTVRFTQALFVDEYDPTIEDSYKHYATIDNKNVLLDILDTAGQEDYASMKESYMRRGEGFLLVFSVTSLSSFKSIQAFYDQIIRVKEDSAFVPIVLIGNKSDLPEDREVSEAQATQLAKDLKVPYIETSAKLDLNVNEAFYTVVKMINRGSRLDANGGGGANTTTTGAAGTTDDSANAANAAAGSTGAHNEAGYTGAKDDKLDGSLQDTAAANTRKQQAHASHKSDSKSSGGGCCTIM